jgi:PAP2 superfamily
MRNLHARGVRRAAIGALVIGMLSTSAFVVAQGINGGFERFWGSRFSSRAAERRQRGGNADAAGLAARTDGALAIAEAERRSRPVPTDARSRLVRWNQIAIDASGVDHTPVQDGETRVFGEQLGPGRASRAIAIVHVAIADAVNAIYGQWQSYTRIDSAPRGASVEAAIAQAAHDTLVAMFPSQAPSFDDALAEDMAQIPPAGKEAGRRVGGEAAALVLAQRRGDRADSLDPRMEVEFNPSDDPGKWRQDPISQVPVALGASWGDVTPFVIESGRQFRVGPPPDMESAAYTEAYNEVKRLGGDGITTPTERTEEQTQIGLFWAYDGTPSLCAPPRLYNQLAMTIADQMGTDFMGLTRLLALVNVAMADAGIASWESKFYYQFWRPITGIRESDEGTGPTGTGDGNRDTRGDATFMPLGAPASNLAGPNFTPPFPAYPSGHAAFGGALFEVLREFYGRDDIAFAFTSDEFNGLTRGHDGQVRPELSRHFTSLSAAEEENGQSRIYLGIHWSFDKTEGIAQGRRVAQYVVAHAFTPR